MQKTNKPILFLHGEADDFIPSEMSFKLYNLSPSENKEIHIIKGADHRSILKDSEYNSKAISEINRFLQL